MNDLSRDRGALGLVIDHGASTMALLKAVSRRAANVTLPDWTSFSRLKRHGLDSLIGYLSDAPSLPSSPSMATGAAAAEVAMEEEAASLLGGQPGEP